MPPADVQVKGLPDRSVTEWEATLHALVDFQRSPGWRYGLLARFRWLQAAADKELRSTKRTAEELRVLQGETKAYERAIMSLEELIRDVADASSRTERENADGKEKGR